MTDGGFRIDLLDVGDQDYADCVLVRFGATSVLIDGGHQDNVNGDERHPPIPDQLAELLEQPATGLHVDLLVVTHAHKDHIGCLPELVAGGLHADHALVADPDWAWGQPDAVDGPSLATVTASLDVPDPAASVLAALREELVPPDADDEVIALFLKQAGGVKQRYLAMLSTLEGNGETHVIRFGRDDDESRALEHEFDLIGLRLLGPSKQLLNALATAMGQRPDAAGADLASAMPDAFADADPVTLYRATVTGILDARSATVGAGAATPTGAAERPEVAALLADDTTAPALAAMATFSGGHFVNCQSVVTVFGDEDHRALLAGDLQFADPETGVDEIEEGVLALWQQVAAQGPYRFVKLSHHGSDNGFPDDLLDHVCDQAAIGICAGEGTRYDPNRCVLEALDARRDSLIWVRTDRNGRSSFTFSAPDAPPEVSVARDTTNVATPNDPDQRC